MGTAGNVLHSTIVVPTVFIAVWLVMISQAHGTFTCYDEHGATVLGPSTVPECCLKGGLSYSTAATLTFEMSNCLVGVAFDRPEYFISEDVGSVEVCAVITGGSFFESFFLKIYTIQDTATAPRDYQQKKLSMEIDSTTARTQCFNISIVNNVVPDTLRKFKLGASSSSHRLSVTISSVVILDDEIGRGCTFKLLNSSVSEEEDRIEVVGEIGDILTFANISTFLTSVSTFLDPTLSISEGIANGSNETDPQPPMKIIYTALTKEFEIEATEEGYGEFVEAVNQVTEAKKAACEGGIINATDVPRLAREYSTFKDNVIENIVQLRDVFGKMLCIKEKESHEMRRKKRDSHCPDRSECVCPKATDGTILWDEIVCVCEFFVCMDPEQDLKPLLGMYDIAEGPPCLALVVDTTGSMSDEIEAAKEVINNFLRSEEEEPVCYALLPFNDLSNDIFIEESIGIPTVASTYNGIISVTELNNFRTVTNGLRASGGNDCPERQLQALRSALDLTDTDGVSIMVPASHIVLLTDAPSHDVYLESEVIRLANDQKVCISFFISMRGGCIDESGRLMYHRIANATGGTVTESISQDGFRDFDTAHEATQCSEFYSLSRSGQRKKRQTLPAPESVCYTVVATPFTSKLKVRASTSQRFIVVTKPRGESRRVSALYGSAGPVYIDASPIAGEYKVCVTSGTLNITVERSYMMDAILKYLKPEKNSSDLITTSTAPQECSVGKISVKTSRIPDIKSVELQLIREGTEDVLVSAPLYGCNDLLLGDITFASGRVKYKMVGQDLRGYLFSIPLTHSAVFKPAQYRVERGDELVEIAPLQAKISRISVCNDNEGPAQYSFSYKRVTGLRQTFRPSNQLVIPPRACNSVNMVIVVISAEPGSTHHLNASVTDGCSTQIVSLTVYIPSPTTTPTTPTPSAHECNCQNGGTCIIRIIRGRVVRRCICPLGWRGLRCSTAT